MTDDVASFAITPPPRLAPVVRVMCSVLLHTFEPLLRAPGLCADMHRALDRGDIAEARGYIAGVGRGVALTPYLNTYAFNVVACALENVFRAVEELAAQEEPDADHEAAVTRILAFVHPNAASIAHLEAHAGPAPAVVGASPPPAMVDTHLLDTAHKTGNPPALKRGEREPRKKPR